MGDSSRESSVKAEVHEQTLPPTYKTIYRMHYAIWYAATGGIASNKEFTGLFDQIQVVTFFVPYLLIAEIVLRRREIRRRATPA